MKSGIRRSHPNHPPGNTWPATLCDGLRVVCFSLSPGASTIFCFISSLVYLDVYLSLQTVDCLQHLPSSIYPPIISPVSFVPLPSSQYAPVPCLHLLSAITINQSIIGPNTSAAFFVCLFRHRLHGFQPHQSPRRLLRVPCTEGSCLPARVTLVAMAFLFFPSCPLGPWFTVVE